jgi:hypothetical protein
MNELGWVVLFVLLMLAVGASQVYPATEVMAVGNGVMLRCAAIGLPLEAVYYLLLGVTLTASGLRPPGWYWRPFQHHHLLGRREKVLVLPFFYAGALAFLGIVLGIFIVVVGMVGAVRQW